MRFQSSRESIDARCWVFLFPGNGVIGALEARGQLRSFCHVSDHTDRFVSDVCAERRGWAGKSREGDRSGRTYGIPDATYSLRATKMV